MPSVHEELNVFFECCERLLDREREFVTLPDEDRKRICFYTNEIAKLTNAQRFTEKEAANPTGSDGSAHDRILASHGDRHYGPLIRN